MIDSEIDTKEQLKSINFQMMIDNDEFSDFNWGTRMFTNSKFVFYR